MMDEEFDPMKEDFNNPEFNSYKVGGKGGAERREDLRHSNTAHTNGQE